MKKLNNKFLSALRGWLMVLLFFAAAPMANAQDPTLDLLTPLDGEGFMIKEVFDASYETTGTWPAGTKFAIVIKADVGDPKDKYQVLKESTDAGNPDPYTVSDISMIALPWYSSDTDDFLADYALGVVAFQGSSLSLHTDGSFDIEMEDLIVIEGMDGSDEMSLEGNRRLLTRAFDLTGLREVQLVFTYSADNILPSSSSLPQLLVSTDGGATFQVLPVDNVDPGTQGYLPANANNDVLLIDVPAAFVTSATHFMWKQQSNRGADVDTWMIEDVSIIAETGNVLEEDWIDITLGWPTLFNYNWAIAENAYGLQPTIYNGATFSFEWSLIDPLPSLPTGTIVEFFLWAAGDFVLNPANNERISLGSVTAAGVYTSTAVPFLLERDAYTVRAFATLDGNLYHERNVGVINVFNDVLRAVPVEGLPVLYAGEEVTITSVLENTIDVSSYDNVWFNLMVTHDGKEWLLDAQQGIDDFVIDLPPYLSGNTTFTIKASANAAVAAIGDTIVDVNDLAIANFTVLGDYGQVGLFKVDIDDVYQTLKFEVNIPDHQNLTEDQMMTLDYSLDGNTFINIATYPDSRFSDDVYFDGNWFQEELTLPEEAQVEDIVLRWRIEEYKSIVNVRNAKLIPFSVDYNNVPLQSISTTINIAPQGIDLTPSVSSVCPDGVIEFDYRIRGRFGEDVVMTITSPAGDLEVDGEDITFLGLTDGTGTISLDLASLDNAISGGNVTFRLEAQDETYQYTTSVNGRYTESSVEIVPTIDNATLFAGSLLNYTHESCIEEERIVIINGVQPFFTYQIRNYVTGELIGEPVTIDLNDDDLMDDLYDSDTYPYYYGVNLDVNIGTIEDYVKVEVLTTSKDAAGDVVCRTIASTATVEFFTRPHVGLYSHAGTNVWRAVADSAEFVICGTQPLSLSIGYWGDASNWVSTPTSVRWYRVRGTEDELLISSNTTLTQANITTSGTYRVKYNDGDCSEGEAVFTVIVTEKPAQPVITYEGSEVICKGSSITLRTASGFDYYRWTRAGAVVQTNDSIMRVSDAGVYRVEASNVPFTYGCVSRASYPVAIEVLEFAPVTFNPTTVTICAEGESAELTIEGLEADVLYTLVNGTTGEVQGTPFRGTGTVRVNTGAISDAITTFSVMGVSDLNGECEEIVSTNIVTVKSLSELQILASYYGDYDLAAGNTYCEGTELAIGDLRDGSINVGTAKWYSGGSVVGTNLWVFANEPGEYSVEYTDRTNSCTVVLDGVTIEPYPVRPVITADGSLSFCQGNSDLTLTAPEGYAAYRWSRNGSALSNISTSDREIVVNQTGTYRVSVETANLCASPNSSGIQVDVHPRPNVPTFMVMDNGFLCEPGAARVQLTTFENDVEYQLYDVMTGAASGAPVLGSARAVITSADLTRISKLELRANRVDAEGCYVVSAPIDVTVYDGSIRVSGNVLTSSVERFDAMSYQWYRNGVLITNGGINQSYTVFDNADYSVVVVTRDGCIIDSSVGDKSTVSTGSITADVFGAGVYPNPVETELMLTLAGEYTGKLSIRIVNLAGVVVYQLDTEKTSTDFRQELNVESLSQGAYMLHITGSDNSEVKRFIKK